MLAQVLIALTPHFALLPVAFAGPPVEVSYEAPTLDQWIYPFNGSPGTRASASIFATDDEPDFDDRDGQMLLGFETAADIEPGLGVSAYDVLSLTVRLTYDGQQEIVYDDSSDSYVGFLEIDDPDYVPDPDPAAPLEIFGAGYRNGFDQATFVEGSPYGPDAFGEGIRNAYALGRPVTGGPLHDIANHVRDEYDVVAWGIGVVAGLAPGEIVPANADFVFEVDVTDPDVAAYLAAGLDAGEVRLMIASLHPAIVQGGSFPTLYTKENPLVIIGLQSAARLEMTVSIDTTPIVGDIDGDGDVDVEDLLAVLAGWGCDSCIDCPADTDGDCDVDVEDLLAVLGNWT